MPSLLLAVHLLHEAYKCDALVSNDVFEKAEDQGSSWEAYIKILPTRIDIPLCWTETELEALSKTSVMGRDILFFVRTSKSNCR